MAEMEARERLGRAIANARVEQQKLQLERISLGGGLDDGGDGERETRWCQERLKELKERTLPGLDKTLASLNIEKSHLLGEVDKVHAELDRITALRSELVERRKAQVMLFHSDAVGLKHGLAALNRDVFSLLREEGVSETTVVDVYSQLQRSLPASNLTKINKSASPRKSSNNKDRSTSINNL